MQLILITVLSGSGKSVAPHVPEVGGYYYVGNRPLQLLPQTIDLLAAADQASVAVSLSMRSAEEAAALPRAIEQFRGRGHDVRMLFLEARPSTLIQRFSE